LSEILGRLEWAKLVVAAAGVEQFDQLVADVFTPSQIEAAVRYRGAQYIHAVTQRGRAA
jgi:hypothetical protein